MEKILIARVRVWGHIVKTVNKNCLSLLDTQQQKLCGYIITFSQNTQAVCDILPISAVSLVNTVKVVYLGSDTSLEVIL
jgi:hypothetical protein